eukprot:TRINITY_DN4223_c0_g1_i1.p1 TRINITY_DN4223_c0_g1~~TRINITY_DN4223_c0_g1_i1.p1  ORF type:complete len:885 (+),score=260.66 TRINITY_DN4223_c0_g1_i1:75-2729(+)
MSDGELDLAPGANQETPKKSGGRGAITKPPVQGVSERKKIFENHGHASPTYEPFLRPREVIGGESPRKSSPSRSQTTDRVSQFERLINDLALENENQQDPRHRSSLNKIHLQLKSIITDFEHKADGLREQLASERALREAAEESKQKTQQELANSLETIGTLRQDLAKIPALEQSLEEQQAALAQHKADTESAIKSKAQLEQSVALLTQKLVEDSNRLHTLSSKKLKLKEELTTLQALLSSNDLQTADTVSQLRAEAERSKAESEALRTSLHEAQERLASISARQEDFQQEKDSLTNEITLVREALQESKTRCQELIETHTAKDESMAALQSQLVTVQQENQALAKAVAEIETNMNLLLEKESARHHEELEAAAASYKAQFAESSSSYAADLENALQEQQEKHTILLQSTLKQLEDRHSSELENRVTELQKGHHQELQERSKQLEETHAQHLHTHLQKLAEEHANELDTQLKQAQENSALQLVSALMQERALFKEQLQSQQTELEDKYTVLLATRLTEMAEEHTKQYHERLTQAMSEEAAQREVVLKEQAANHANQLASLSEAHTTASAQESAKHRSELEAINASYSAQMESLRTQLEEEHRLVSLLRSENDTLQSSSAALQSLVQNEKQQAASQLATIELQRLELDSERATRKLAEKDLAQALAKCSILETRTEALETRAHQNEAKVLHLESQALLIQSQLQSKTEVETQLRSLHASVVAENAKLLGRIQLMRMEADEEVRKAHAEVEEKVEAEITQLRITHQGQISALNSKIKALLEQQHSPTASPPPSTFLSPNFSPETRARANSTAPFMEPSRFNKEEPSSPPPSSLNGANESPLPSRGGIDLARMFTNPFIISAIQNSARSKGLMNPGDQQKTKDDGTL